MNKYGKRMQTEEDVGFPEGNDIRAMRPTNIGPVSDPEQYERSLIMDAIIEGALTRGDIEPKTRQPSSMGEMQDVKSMMPSPTPTPTPFDVDKYLNRSPSSLSKPDYIDKYGYPVHEFEDGLNINRFPENFFSSEYARQLQPEKGMEKKERFKKIKETAKSKK